MSQDTEHLSPETTFSNFIASKQREQAAGWEIRILPNTMITVQKHNAPFAEIQRVRYTLSGDPQKPFVEILRTAFDIPEQGSPELIYISTVTEDGLVEGLGFPDRRTIEKQIEESSILPEEFPHKVDPNRIFPSSLITNIDSRLPGFRKHLFSFYFNPDGSLKTVLLLSQDNQNNYLPEKEIYNWKKAALDAHSDENPHLFNLTEIGINLELPTKLRTRDEIVSELFATTDIEDITHGGKEFDERCLNQQAILDALKIKITPSFQS